MISMMDHQSEEATDCRWLRLLFYIVLNRMVFPKNMGNRVREVLEFPHRGNLRSVRPFIRATEMALSGPMEGEQPSSWPEEFWKEVWERTDCILARRKTQDIIDRPRSLNILMSLYVDVHSHFYEIAEDTSLNPKRDAVFGLVLYAIVLAVRAIQSGGDIKVDGRIILRSLVECYIILTYLAKRDRPELWDKYRKYGVGQTKLAFLKLYDLDPADLPEYVKLDDLERLAGEDAWQEFTKIELGSWSGIDLRRMSEEIGIKGIYDKYYVWPSSFVHAEWGAVRDTVFDLCVNPLHRMHRVPSAPRIDVPSVAPDVAKILNMTLETLNTIYPPFKKRVGRFPHRGQQTSGSEPAEGPVDANPEDG